MISPQFKEFVETHLGDIVVLNNGAPISQKINNYLKAWEMASIIPDAGDHAQWCAANLSDVYEMGNTPVTIDRSRAYAMIFREVNNV